MKAWIEDNFEMPDSTVALLIGFLEQNEGILSKRAREKEFLVLGCAEINEIEYFYKKCFLNDRSEEVQTPKDAKKYLELIEQKEKIRKKMPTPDLKITYRKNQKGYEKA